MDKNSFRSHILVSALTASLVVALTFTVLFLWGKNHPDSLYKIFGQSKESGSAMLLSEEAVIDAVARANPAVVAITISKNIPVYERYFRTVPSPFGDFFGFTIPEYRQRGVRRQEIGGGSGFLVSSDGYILTNRHVVEDEDAEYTVFLNDGKKYDAHVVTRDSELDIALVKIEGSEFPYLPFGDSDKLHVGQSVIAIGNALAEFRNTVSLGIVSGLSRSIVASDLEGNRESLDQLIQTDAAINQGNSGGPLLNIRGEVVGINVAVATEAENIGFAISSNSAKKIMESVRTGKE